MCNIVYYDRHPSCHRHVVVLLSISSSSVETKIRSTASSFLILSTELYLLIIFHPMKFGTDGAVLLYAASCNCQYSRTIVLSKCRLYGVSVSKVRVLHTCPLASQWVGSGCAVCGVRCPVCGVYYD